MPLAVTHVILTVILVDLYRDYYDILCELNSAVSY